MSLDTVELMMEFEEEFDLTVPNDVASRMTRLGDFQAHAVRALRERGEAVDEAAVWGRIKDILRKDFGVADDLLVPEARIVHDLGLD